MTNKQAINALKMDNALMEFDPSTGEKKPIELQNEDNQDLYKANLVAIEVLEKQLNNGWIPVSERLPTVKECQENDCRFIVTDGNRRYQSWFDYKNNYFDRCACNGLGLKRDSCVIAWQPLPEPFLQNVRRGN